MLIEHEREEFWNEIFSPEAEGVRITAGPADDQLTIDYIDDHCVHGLVIDVRTYYDGVLRDTLNWLQSKNNHLAQEKAALSQENLELKERVAKLNQALHGTSSEQSISPASDPQPEIDVADPKVAKLPKERIARNAGRKPLPDHLPRDQRDYVATSCPCCNSSSLHVLGEEITEQFTIIPEQARVIKHVRKKYRCRSCEKVFAAKAPKHLIEKSSYASPEFLAYVACNKYQFGLPFYRQEKVFNQRGIPINRTTLANLMNGTSDKLSALIALLREELLDQGVIHADETRFQVLKEPGRKATTQSWLWLYRSRENEQHQIVLFDYQQTRAGEHPRRFLGMGSEHPYKGSLQTDAYAAYNLEGIILHGCLSHARRKFVKVVQSLPNQACNSPAHIAIELIGRLYGIERRIKECTDQVRYRVRQEESIPVLNELKAWLDDMQPRVTPRSSLGNAIGYTLDQWSKLSRYVEDGRMSIDNNLAEREIKAVVIGRKNWLFADGVEGAHTNAIMYSLVQTAVANKIDPFKYLQYVIKTMPELKTADEVRCLLPWNMPADEVTVCMAA